MTDISSRPIARSFNRHHVATALWGIVLFLAFAFLLRLLLQPDPDGRLIWARAQRLEASNLIRPALRQYELLANTYPGSPYASRALQREGDILTDLGRAGDATRFRQALDVYGRLAQANPQSDVAANALLSIGEIQLEDLKNPLLARATYERLMRDYPGRRDVMSQVMLALGRVAQAARDGKTAQKWFQKVLQTFPEQPARSAEAQFRLGETYETLWRNKDWARNAYDATIHKYPNSVWAGRARENLGLLVYGEIVPRARRVLVHTDGAFPDALQTTKAQSGATPNSTNDFSQDDLMNALRIALSARALAPDEATLRGWSLQPFVAGFDTSDAGQLSMPQPDAFENIVALCGLTYNVSDGGDDKSARQNLQNEIDTGHMALVYTGQWQFVVGYDSSQDIVFLQNGARVLPTPVAQFVKDWNGRSPLGAAFTMVTFSSQDDDAKRQTLQAQKQKTSQLIDRILAPRKTRAGSKTAPLSSAADLPNPVAARARPLLAGTKVSSVPGGLVAPTWLFTLPPLDEKTIYRRALRRAALWMRRPRIGQTLLNLEALRTVAGDLGRLSVAAPPNEYSIPRTNGGSSPTPSPENTPDNEPLARNDGSIPSSETANAVASPDGNGISNDATSNNVSSAAPAASPSGASSGSPSGSSSVATPAPLAAAPAPISQVDATTRLRALLSWRGAPLTQWINARRDATAYLDVASTKLHDSSLKSAGQAFAQSVGSLENARLLLDNVAALDAAGNLGQNGTLSNAARGLLARASREIENARRQESRATDLMAQV